MIVGRLRIEVSPYIAPVSQTLSASPEKGERRQFRGRYTNIDYGFSVVIPDGLVGENAPAPAPNHGFGIRWSTGSTLWVDASYEVVPYELGRFNARLGKLKASRGSWSERKNGAEVFHEGIAARGFDRGSPIIYNIQVETTPEHRAEAERAFSGIVKSFRTLPVHP